MPRHSVGASHEVWRKRFGRFARSGLAVARFCAREGVSVAAFYYWRKKLMPNGRHHRRRDLHAGALQRKKPMPNASARRRPGQRMSFQPVTVVPAAPGVSIHLACGTRIEMGAADLDTVRAVVAEVARANRDLQRDGVSC